MSFHASLDQAWIGAWLDAVAQGSGAVSQRALVAIERHGGLDAAIAAAKMRNVHLTEVVDTTGKLAIAASRVPVRSLC